MEEIKKRWTKPNSKSLYPSYRLIMLPPLNEFENEFILSQSLCFELFSRLLLNYRNKHKFC